MDPAFSRAFRALHESRVINCGDLLLLMLSNQRKGGWLMKDLVLMSAVGSTTLTMAKNSLVAQGMAEEHLPYRDRRTVKIYLTDAGQKKAAQLWEAVRGLAKIERSYRGSNPPE